MTSAQIVKAHIAEILALRGPLAARELAELYSAAVNAEGEQLVALCQLIATRFPVDRVRVIEAQGW